MTSVREIAENPDQFRTRYIAMRRRLLNAANNEWLASFNPVIYGTLEIPQDDEPIICIVLNEAGTRMSSLHVLQHLVGKTWLNCYDGTVFDLEHGERVIPLSGVSRTAGTIELRVWEVSDGP